MSYTDQYPDRVSLRLPPHWVDILKESARAKNQTVSEILRELINWGFNCETEANKRSKAIRDQATLPYLSDEELERIRAENEMVDSLEVPF